MQPFHGWYALLGCRSGESILDAQLPLYYFVAFRCEAANQVIFRGLVTGFGPKHDGRCVGADGERPIRDEGEVACIVVVYACGFLSAEFISQVFILLAKVLILLAKVLVLST